MFSRVFRKNNCVSNRRRTRCGKGLEATRVGGSPSSSTAIQALAKNPRPAGCRKLVGTENDWRIRVGDYRIIYEIADKIRIVRINRVRHRRDVYR